MQHDGSWLAAGFWGLVSGSSLVIGALLGFLLNLPSRLIAGIMAFGSGVLISALSFELMDEASRTGGLTAAGSGFIAGAAVYTIINYRLSKHGAKHRKRSQRSKQPSESESPGSGLTIAIGALLDGIPESIVVGLSLIHGGHVGIVAVIAIFLSNLPEGLSSSAGMKKAGRSWKYVFGVWGAIMAISGVAALLGFVVFSKFSSSVIGATTATAAGAILCMLVDTMIPEAFAETPNFAGMIAVIGFLLAYVLSSWA